MTSKTLKIAVFSVMAVGLTTASAFAGGGKDCKDKKHSAMKSEAAMTSTASTAVLSASESATAEKAMKVKKTYTFDQALEKCQAKGADDLQACIDYKTGKSKVKPLS